MRWKNKNIPPSHVRLAVCKMIKVIELEIGTYGHYVTYRFNDDIFARLLANIRLMKVCTNYIPYFVTFFMYFRRQIDGVWTNA